jgi:hypothetical protein
MGLSPGYITQMATNVLSDWITAREAGVILGVSRQRAYELIEAYGITTCRVADALKVVKRTDIERLAKMDRPTGIHIGATNHKVKGSRR